MKKVTFSILLSLLLVACSKGEAVEELVEEEQAEETPSQQTDTEVQEEDALYSAPFTGKAVVEEIEQRPFLVTINNHPQARPQSGIASADIVYEMLAEGDVTRLLALYQSEMPENIGPVRSARSYFVDIAKGLDAFYIAHGYSPEAQTMLQNSTVDNLNGMNYDGTLFKRASHRVAPHNSYITPENIIIGAEKVNASMLYNKKVSYAFYDEQESVKIGTDATNINVSYGSKSFDSRYEYDVDNKTYARFSADVATVDELTNRQVHVTNLLFFEMPHKVIDQQGRRHIDIENGGKAYVAYHGTIREVAWENRDGLLVAVEDNGEEVLLAPGKTWVHFIPTSPGLVTAVIYSK